MLKDNNFDILLWQIKITLKFEEEAIYISIDELIRRYVRVDNQYRSYEIKKLKKSINDKNIYAEVFMHRNINGVLDSITKINLYCARTLDYVQVSFEDKIIFSTEEYGRFLINNESMLQNGIYWPQGIEGLLHAILAVEKAMELAYRIEPKIKKRILDTLSENFENSKMQMI